jgi:hypothetical protein
VTHSDGFRFAANYRVAQPGTLQLILALEVMMRAYIIMTQEAQPFFAKISPALKGVGITDSLHSLHSDNLELRINERIKAADIVFIMVNKSLLDNSSTKMEMQIALASSLNNDNPSIFPIILDDTPIPRELQSILCARCDSSSEVEIQQLMRQIRTLISGRQQRADIHKKRTSQREKYLSITSFLSVLLTIFAGFITFLLGDTHYSNIFGDSFSTLLILGLVTVATMLIVSTYLAFIKRGKRIEEREDSEYYSQKLKEAITPSETTIKVDGENIQIFTSPNATELNNLSGQSTNPDIDALGRMLINLEDIKEFYTWSQKQAKGAFKLAIFMCVGGFVLMVAAISLPIFFGLSMQMSIVPAIGGAIAELVAGTALFVYRSSLTQLNHYHKALHEDERFLSSVNLITKFNSLDVQDEMLKEIIRSEIQMNLISVSTSDFETSISPKNHKKISEHDTEQKGKKLANS